MARKVFVGGSIRVNTLPSSVKQILDAEIAAGSLFIVSDADGVDEEVQKHLYERKYRNVEIYTMRTSRKNIGNWPVKYHEAPSGVYGGAYHAIKDREMDRAADAGIMIWDGKSSGTRNNIAELLQAGKPTFVSNVALKKNELYLTLDEFKIGLPSHTKNIQEAFLKAPKNETRELSTMDKKQIYPQGQDMETYPIEGLIVLRGWLNPQEQEKLLKTIDGRPWSNALKRKTQHEGWRYSYDRRPLNETDYLGDISPDLAALVTRLQADGGTTFENLKEQAIVNNYEKSEGIGTHIDHVGNFGPAVVSLSLGSAANMEFARAEKTVNVRLEPGDLCIMTGAARYKWTHTIKSHEQRRVSVTFRSIAERELVAKVTDRGNVKDRSVEENIPTQREPGWLLPHVLGKKDMTAEIAEIGKKLQNLDPKSCGVKDAEAYRAIPHVAIVGSRKHENDPIRMERARWASRTFAESGYIINTGGAEGPDTAAKQGALESKVGASALEISHPYERVSKGSRDPGNYVLTQPQLKAAAHEFIRGITDNFDRNSQFARDLQGRDVTQVTSRDGKNWVKGVFYSAPEKATGEIDSGTRFAVYTARCTPALGGPVIPTYNMDINWEAYRSAVVSLANEQRVVIGKKPLPEDWSPEHESYLKVIGKDHAIQATEKEKAENDQIAIKEAQVSARRLMWQVREVFAQTGVTAVFKKIEPGDSLDGIVHKIDGRVVAIGKRDQSGEYTLVNLDQSKIEGTIELNDLVQITRGAHGLLNIDIQERIPEKEHISSQGR